MFAEKNISISPWPTEKVVRFLEGRGQRVIRAASGCWHEPYGHGRIVMPLPVQRCVTPEQSEIAEVFRQAPAAWFLRYASDPGGEPLNSLDSFRWVCRPPYGLEKLSANIRHNVRRGLRRAEMRKITFREILDRGWEAHSDTMRRHGEKPGGFGVDAGLDEYGGYEAWGAFVDDSLAAYTVTLIMDDWAHFLVARSTDRHLKRYPNNALLFFVCERLFERGYIAAASRGFESVKGPEGLESYNASMGFRKEPVQQVIAVRPSMRLLLNRYTIAAALPVLKLLGANRATRMLRLIRTGPASA